MRLSCMRFFLSARLTPLFFLLTCFFMLISDAVLFFCTCVMQVHPEWLLLALLSCIREPARAPFFFSYSCSIPAFFILTLIQATVSELSKTVLAMWNGMPEDSQVVCSFACFLFTQLPVFLVLFHGQVCVCLGTIVLLTISYTFACAW